MSLKLAFLAFKESCSSCPKWAEGSGGGRRGGKWYFEQNLKEQQFFRDVIPYMILSLLKSACHKTFRSKELNELVYSNVPGPGKCYWVGISDIEAENK